MSVKQPNFLVFISAAEPSGDRHCANLIRALKQKHASIKVVGVGGPKMAEAGCELLEDTVNRAAMILGSLKEVGYFWRLLRRIRAYFAEQRVDLVIVCDSPAFNFHVARTAKRAGLRTLFYVAPQLWAWGSWRIKKLRRCCDKLCCILPFEETWFKDRGIDATFVSNPMLDNIGSPVHACLKTYEGFDPSHLKLALMPGSRTSEIHRLWQPMQQIALRLQAQYPHATITTVAVNNERRRILEHVHIQGFTCTYTVDSVRDTATKADFALVASGSATLEVASAGCPMVAMYQSNRFLWHVIGRFLIKCPYFTLINLVSDQALIPEFMPYFTSIDPIVVKVTQMIDTPGELARISRALIKTIEPLTGRHTSDEVAAIVMDMLTSGQGPNHQPSA